MGSIIIITRIATRYDGLGNIQGRTFERVNGDRATSYMAHRYEAIETVRPTFGSLGSLAIWPSSVQAIANTERSRFRWMNWAALRLELLR